MSWRVFRRDLLRLFRIRKTWVIVIGVLITPALYAWFNINAFWDPYAGTGNIRVAVANLDEGATSEATGPIDVGAQVVEKLEDNDQLGWTFMDEDEAHEAVASGEVYAAIVIPPEFSRDLVSITTGEFTRPVLRYYVNEKANAIAPKITDVGASTLEEQITTAFVEQVAQAATEGLKDAGESAELRILTAQTDTLNAFDEAVGTITSAREGLAELQSDLTGARENVSSARGSLGDVGKALSDVQTALAQAQSLIDDAQQEVIAFTDAATSAYVDGAAALADASAAADVSVTRVTQALEQADARLDAAVSDVEAVVDANAAAIARLQDIVGEAGLDPALAQRLNDAISVLRDRNPAHQQLLTDLRQLGDSAAGTISAIQTSADAIDAAVQQSKDAAADVRGVLTDSVPALNDAMTQLSTASAAFSAAVGAQHEQVNQADALLEGLDGQLVSSSAALSSLDGNLAEVQEGLDLARTDVIALGTASSWGAFQTLTGLNPEQIAQFIASPVTVEHNVVFPVETYGSAMAALFTNLSLWIGAFVLMVIFKIEVDTEGVERITVRQAYVGRFLLFAVLAAAQALIVCLGNLVIGVQTVNAFAFVATGVFTGFAYISIIYALCVSFGHVGRGLCVLLVIMQIPGASGLYPIEMMPGFFRAIYPFLPFTYGIDAMRETIAGFYHAHFWRYIAALALFIVISFVLGLVLRRRLANLNLVFNRGITATDLLIGEEVQVTDGRYRLPDLIHALSDRHEFRDDLAHRAYTFTRRYPVLLRTTLVVGGCGLAVLGVIGWAMSGGKSALLGIAVLWCLLTIAALISLEYIRQSFDLAGEVAGLDDADLRRAVLNDGPGRHLVPAGSVDRSPEGGDLA